MDIIAQIHETFGVFFEPHYQLLRALHIISVISWMAGLLYLPRLFVYHVERAKTPEMQETFKIMEHRLLNYIMHPALAASWISGTALLLSLPWEGTLHLWMIIKITGALALSGMHFLFAHQVKVFAKNENKHSGKYYRIINELPTLLMILIVVMAVIEPFGDVLL